MARKPNFVRKKKRRVHGATFWDTEYTNPTHLKLSTAESADLAKFTRWLGRQNRPDILAPGSSVFDAGCGNGRNLIYLANQFGMAGVGIDISRAAIAQAKSASLNLPLHYHVQSAGAALPVANESQQLILDMMSSHFLSATERIHLRNELYRILAPGGYGFIKTFLKDDDLHTARLLTEHPGPESGSYIHPVMGVAEYVYSEEELLTFLQSHFIIRKVYRSHKHVFRGQARKRRTISVYVEKDFKA
jgi:SAM-dependent methyltransferase